MKVFHCDHCGQLLFFENVRCVRCGRALAYVPELADVMSLDPSDDGLWRSPLTKKAYRLCENYTKHNVCNWAFSVDHADTSSREALAPSLCRACRLTRTIPNLSRSGNDALWYRLEAAKRRLVYTLDQLGLPLKNRVEDPEHGLVFDLLEDPEPGASAAPVLTGHAAGVITVNVAEADETERVRRRTQLNEPYRTLLGHFRHEAGHYYWDQLVRDSDRLGAFRDLFGDERADYTLALERHYQAGSPAGWDSGYVTAYAAAHPWEDWAETWAHYLHMTDTLETSSACGISIKPPRTDEPRLTSIPNPLTGGDVAFDRMMDGWGTITYVLNNLSRGLGNGDAYPFVLSTRSVDKLRFVHETIHARSERSRRSGA